MSTQQKSLSDRMKEYEMATRVVLPSMLPVIIRVDGKSFHSYTRGCEPPFDDMFNWSMDQVAIDLCKLIQGAKFAYVQSDEVSVLVHNYTKINSESWFDNKVQKMCSVSAAQAAVTMTCMSSRIFGETKQALFDSRVFVIPERDVANYFLHRRNDAERNTTQTLARYLFGHKEIFGKSVSQMRELCSLAKNPWQKQKQGAISGRIIRKVPFSFKVEATQEIVERFKWEPTPARNLQWLPFVQKHLQVDY